MKLIVPALETHLKIAYIRKERKLSQTEIAEILGISQNSYSRIERGETKLTIDRIKEIATILKVDYNELIANDSQEVTAMYQDISEQHEREKEELEVKIKLQETIIKSLEIVIRSDEKINKGNEMIISLLQDKIKLLEELLNNSSQNE